MAVDVVASVPRLTVAELVARLEAGVREVQDGEGWRAYLAAMSRFHQYSTGGQSVAHPRADAHGHKGLRVSRLVAPRAACQEG